MGFLRNVISLFGARHEEPTTVEIPQSKPANDVQGIVVGRVVEDGWIKFTITGVTDSFLTLKVNKIKNDRWRAFLNEGIEYTANKHVPGSGENPPVIYEVPEEDLNCYPRGGPQVLLWYWPDKNDVCLEWDM